MIFDLTFKNLQKPTFHDLFIKNTARSYAMTDVSQNTPYCEPFVTWHSALNEYALTIQFYYVAYIVGAAIMYNVQLSQVHCD